MKLNSTDLSFQLLTALLVIPQVVFEAAIWTHILKKLKIL
jgi:hypothetical protein